MIKRIGRKVPYKAGRGTVVLISTLLICSALLRVSFGNGVAFAQGLARDDTVVTQSAVEIAAPPAASADAAPLNRAEVGSLLAALQEREARVRKRERQMEMRRKALQVADEEIEIRLRALAQAEADLRKTLTIAESAAENDIIQLITVYENMKPKDAAALFQTMDPEFAAGFLGRMSPGVAAAVMAGLSPESAYSISVILAGRNANAPKS